jgi:hypothetical protein
MASAEALFLDENSVWVTDGSKSGTHQLLLRADPGQELEGLIGPYYFAPFDGKLLFFELEYGSTGYHVQIYTTNGTQSGTKEFTIPALSYYYPNFYLEDADFAAFDGRLLILDSVTAVEGEPPKVEFLVTNLTKGGTKTFTIAGPPLPFNFDPSEFTGFGKLVLFSATNHAGVNTLWASNGSAAGTKALTVKGASSYGLDAADLTVYRKEILFSGDDSAGYRGLWVTNGTAGGTHEIAQTGEPFGYVENLNPQDLLVVGNKVLFIADGGLWQTNGTAVRTAEIVIRGASEEGIDPEPSELVGFGDRVLFVGNTAAGGTDIFVSDGSSKGSFALSWSGASPQDFSVFGSLVLFKAEDSADKEGLWATNGTANGTHEIKINGAYFYGILDFESLAGAVIGKEFVFIGTDRLENTGLWVTNGTAAGTHEVYAPLSVADLTAVPSAHAAPLLADAGDILIAGRHSTLRGTAGSDLFEFATPGSPLHPDSNVILHFDAADDQVAFSDPGFHLGLANPSAAPQALPADLFGANPTGKFNNATERFAYDTRSGALFYDAHGDRPGSSRELVATFAGHPHLTAGDVFFVS